MRRYLLTFLALVLLAAPLSAGTVPRLRGRVNDYAGVLSARERADLDSTLAQYERETTHQVVILTVKSLNGETIETYSLRVAGAWRLGRRGFDNGVLLTVAMQQRAIRVELGAGMSRYVSDADAKTVIDAMVPAFRGGRVGDGMKIGVNRLMVLCRAYKVPRSR
jgi:uncharacterized protein